MPKKNALAELAEDLAEIVKDTRSDFYTTRIRMAQRIVAELAKVQIADGMSRRAVPRANCLGYSFGNEPPKTVGIFTTEHFPKWFCSAVNAVEKCRAIAEEGANNGK